MAAREPLARLDEAGSRAGPFALAAAVRVQSVATLAERLTGLHALAEVYERRPADAAPRDFIRYALDALALTYTVHGAVDIPATGPLLIAANHPHGAADGLLLADLLLRHRPDVRLMANRLLRRIPELAPIIVPVDVFRTGTSLRGLREALRHVASGGALIVFPAGEVSRLSRSGRVVDPPWTRTLGALAQHSDATVVTAHVGGRAPLLSLLAGSLHPRLRTALLARDLVALRGRHLDVTLGAPLTAAELAAVAPPGRTPYLRLLAEGLAPEPAAARSPVVPEPIAAAVEPAALARCVAGLPPSARLCRSTEFEVYFATAGQIPPVLDEIARLRETSFRAVGEGTGRAADRDDFDENYGHLFLWHPARREVVGAYRVGATADLLPQYGLPGLYTSTLFEFAPGLFERLGPSLELGRSFVRGEWQRSYRPLQLLWAGISALLDARPEIHYLFGPVSISASYRPSTRRLIAAVLGRHHAAGDIVSSVRARRPPDARGSHVINDVAAALADPQLLSRTVARLERGRGIPVLLRQYLELRGQFAGFSVDPLFADALDGLVFVQVAQVPDLLRRRLRRLAVPGAAKAD